ncbi:hypothetical protein Ddye_020659 [Dipteronia dyeriana]|uniref:Uncharacterized protein n=1 Tax=Dipteronia dyeriana TaxID=168575 RepID=A0AAD9WVK4_9ROSI|nr:hypothetical protein Ddye_020659 [Dipteronia dyeriana]
MATHSQYQTHDQEYLRKVAAEGFALVDKFYGRGIAKIFHPPPPAPHAPTTRLYYPQQSQVVVKVEKPVMYRNEAAQRFDGTLIPDYRTRKPASRAVF